MPGEQYLPAVKFEGDGIYSVVVFFMEWTWPARNSAQESKHGRVQGHFDPLHTVYSRRPVQ
jgi:hypothetical protein